MTLTDRARQLRQTIEISVQSLDDAMALDAVELYPDWKPDTEYKTGQKVRHHNILYKCLQDHTSMSNWDPANTPSLFARVLNPDPEIIPDWERPDSTNGYMTGDKVKFEGNVYESLIDNNVWSPAEYPDGWKLI